MKTIRNRRKENKIGKDPLRIFYDEFERTAVGLAHVDRHGIICHVNQRFCEITGYSKEELIGISLFDVIDCVDVHKDCENIKKVLSGETNVHSMEKIFYRQDRLAPRVLLTVSSLYEKLKNNQYLVAVAYIDCQKLAEQEPARNKDIFKAIFESANVGFIYTATDGVILNANRKSAEIFGYKRQEVIGKNSCDVHIVTPDNSEKRVESLADIVDIQCGPVVEYEILNSHKKKVVIEVESKFIGDKDNIRGILAIIKDITQWRQTEKTLFRSEKKYHELIENIPYCVAEIDVTGTYIYNNETYKEVLGYDKDELVGKTIFDLQPGDKEKDDLSAYFDCLIKEQPAPTTWIGKNIAKDGRTIDVEIAWDYRKDNNGKIVGFVFVSKDVTESLRHVKCIIENRSLLQSIFNGISEPLILLDNNQRILIGNRAAEIYFKTESLNMIGKPCYETLTNRTHPCEHCLISLSLPGEKNSFERKSPLYPERIENITTYPIKLENTDATILRISDITESKKLHQELIHADKMISLGILVSGVAHEINNPNNFIALNTPLLFEVWESIMPILDKYYTVNGDFSMGGLPYSEMREEIPNLFKGIKDGSDRIKNIVQALKNYSRQDTTEMNQSVDINDVIKNAIIILDNLIKKSTEKFSVEYGEHLKLITGDHQRLEQVMINLLQNACQALPDKTKGISITSSYNKHDNNIIVEVMDEGTGIQDDLRSRIMDPFFTTRQNEGGTGLGLSVSSNIISEHGGKLEVDSGIGRGSVFKVILPVERHLKPIKILIADDEEGVRKYLGRAFSKKTRHIIHEASNGVETCIKLGNECPDLLILDIMMPDMDGVQVCRVIKQAAELSKMKVIIMTGHRDSPKIKEITDLGFNHILIKPFDISQLKDMVDGLFPFK